MLNQKERAILAELQINPYISQQKLAEKINLSRSATANLISSLVSKGYILGKAYVLNSDKTIVCIGGANVDHKLQLQEPLQMHTSNPISSVTTIGGVVRNLAENLGRLDQNVSLLSIVGNDMNGKSILEYCKEYMSVYEVEILQNFTTGSYSALLDTNGEMVLGIADMDIYTKMTDRWLARHRQVLASSKLLVTDTNVERSAIEYLIGYSNEIQKDLVIVGVSGPKTDRIPIDLAGVYLVIFNKDESQTYFETDEDNTEKLVEMWHKKKIQYAIVTEGPKGAYYCGPDGEVHHAPALKIDQVIDATGAGDAFSSGVIYGMNTNHNLHDSITFGQLNAAGTIQSLDSVRKDLTIQTLLKEKEHYDANS